MPETNKHLSDEDVRRILEMSSSGASVKEISETLALSMGRVWCAVRGVTWKGASGDRQDKVYGEVTESKANSIIRLRTKFGVTIAKLSKTSNLSETTVREILKGKKRKLWAKRIPVKGR
jgi:hypothetical protein